jgi:ribose transport system substrate-binding protein
VAQQAGCYLVNPISSANLIPSLAHVPKGTPIVNIDSPVDAAAAGAAGVHIKSYIGTDNVAAGKLAADAMARFVGPGDRVAVISGIPGDATSGARTRGFRQGTRGRFTVVESVAADFDRGRAAQATDEVVRSDPRIRGVFAVNDEMALGVADTVRRLGRTGRIAVIGLDGIRDALDAIRLGKISATVAQYPFAIGQLGIEACVAALHGQQLPARVGAPIQLITRSNVARALARFPQPVSTFNDPLARLLRSG